MRHTHPGAGILGWSSITSSGHIWPVGEPHWGGLTVNTCAGPVGAATAAVLATLALQQGNKLFVWHPIFMTASVLCFSAAAVDAIKRRKTAARDRRVSLSQLHWMLIDASAASMGVGMWAIYTVKNRPLDQHFTSLHSLVGLSALGLYALNLASGGYSTLGPLVSGKSMNLVWKDWTHRLAPWPLRWQPCRSCRGCTTRLWSFLRAGATALVSQLIGRNREERGATRTSAVRLASLRSSVLPSPFSRSSLFRRKKPRHSEEG